MRHGSGGLEGSLLGRERELALLADFVRPTGGSPALLVRGEPGVGKTTLIEATIRRAESAGTTVLQARGYQGEARLPFAALHQLLRPVLRRVETLPERQRSALRAAFAMETEGVPPDRMLVGLAALTLLSELGEQCPALLVVDDVQWLDRASQDAIGFLGRRLRGEPVAVLTGTRGSAPASFGADFAELDVEPLSAHASVELLDLQPVALAGTVRRRLLNQARGNPLAIIELTKVAGDEEGRFRSGEHFPLTERLERIFAMHLAELPRPTRNLLLLMSTADGFEWPMVVASMPGGFPVDALLPAERAQLLHHGDLGPYFRHPLIRSALYHTASLEERRAAHRTVAQALERSPDRRAWHLAAAASGPDEDLAVMLSEVGERAGRLGAPSEALAAMERSAELTPDATARARRLARAAQFALFNDRPDKVEQYAATAAALTDAPDVRDQLPAEVGWAVSNTGRQDAAMELLIAASRAAAERTPQSAVGILGVAASAAFHSGRREHREQIRQALAQVTARIDDPPLLLWIDASTDFLAARERIRQEAERSIAEGSTEYLSRLMLGVAAGLADLPAEGIELLGSILDPERNAALSGNNSSFLTFYGHACLDAGKWPKAEAIADYSIAISLDLNPGLATAMGQSLKAMLAALCGRADEARTLAQRAMAAADPQSRIVGVRCGRALGLAAAAEGDHDAAYDHFRGLFTHAGEPLHDHHSYYALGDLAAAAIPAGQAQQAETVLAVTAADLAQRSSPRLDLLMSTARALLARSDADAERHFRAALAVPEGDRWPYERARARLAHGQWLRRQQRIKPARTELTAALDAFEHLGAVPWAERARGELRAAGVQTPTDRASLTSRLTAQELQIVRLAGLGLTNKEIGERLFLSHRTVGSHLYRIFPKLNITTRAQLHAFVDTDSD
ncbi:AAA family ATPase [Streptomyces sp. NPDC048277]|uniref:ATP-binding protein n=1 Tax=Streptomyces sp. NPDC048277 TaxID=3155027 RepID=UPI0033D28BA3